MDWQWAVVAIIAVPLVYRLVRKWLVLPLKVGRKSTLRIRRVWEATDAGGLTPEFQEFVGRMLAPFREIGFEVVSNSSSRDSVPGFRSVQVVLVNRTAGDVASIVGVWGKQRRNLTFQIARQLADGRRVGVVQSRVVPLTPADPEEDVLRVSWLDDPRALYEAHRRRLAARGLERVTGEVPAAGAEAAWMDKVWERKQARLVSIGHRYRDEAAGVLRFTVKGAYLSAWRSMEPIGGWRERWHDRRARREWRALGMEGWPTGNGADEATAQRTDDQGAQVASGEAAATDGEKKGVTYAVPLRDGEVRLERGPEFVVARVGGKPIMRYLLGRWPTLVWIGVAGGWGMVSLLFWCVVVTGNGSAPAPVLSAMYWSMFVMFACALAAGVALARRAIRRRGIAEVRADRSGLTFRNAPMRRRSGRVAWAEIDSLMVVQLAEGWSPCYRLEVRSRRVRQVLVISRDREGLLSARRAIVTVMGIESGGDEAEAVAGAMAAN